jgi:hypothetical protein
LLIVESLTGASQAILTLQTLRGKGCAARNRKELQKNVVFRR